MAITGYCLSIAAAPYVFGTSSVTTLPTSSSDDWSSAWTLVSAGLRWGEDGYTIAEDAHSDGTFESDSIDFVIEDLVVSSGIASGYHVGTYLFARDPNLVPSTRLTATIASSGVLTFDVDDFAALGLGASPTNFPLWIDRECIFCSSVAGDTVTVGGGGRGYFASLAAQHTIDDDRRVYPEVWSGFPTATRRKAILWSVSDANVATAVWRGTVNLAPRLADNGAPIALQCEPVWIQQAAEALGDEYATCRITGISGWCVRASVVADGGTAIGGRFAPAEYRSYSTLSEACQGAQDEIRRRLVTAGFTAANPRVLVVDGGVSFRLDAASGVSNAQVSLNVGQRTATGTTTEAAGTRRAEARVEGTPTVMCAAAPGLLNNVIPIDTAARLPTSWAAVGTWSDAGYTTTLSPSLRGAVGEGEEAVVTIASLELTATAANGSTAPYILGSFRIVPRDGAAPAPVPYDRFGNFVQVIDQPTLLKVTAQLVTGHWAAGLRRAIGEPTLIRSQLDARDWDLSSAALARIFAATAGPFSRREWSFDGSYTLGQLLRDELPLNGCVIGTSSDGRLTIVPIGPATATATVAATLTELDLLDNPRWERLVEEQITSVECDIDGTPVKVNDTRAIGRYGQGRTAKVTLRGRQAGLRASSDILGFASQLLGRVVGPYSDPVGQLTVSVPAAQYINTIYIGSYVDISEWLAPTGYNDERGTGGAGALAAYGDLSARAQCIGRRADLGKGGALELKLLCFPQVSAYAPCARVETTDTTTEIAILVGWLNDVGDYTDPDAGAADGGASMFHAGDNVRLIKRNVTTESLSSSLQVLSVVSNVITFTSAIDAGVRTSILAGDWWDVIPDTLSNTVGGNNEAAQLAYAYVGALATGIIDGEADHPVRAWAP